MDVLHPQDCLTNPLSKRTFISPHMKKHGPKNPTTTVNRSNRSPNKSNRRNSDNKRKTSPPPSRAAVVNKSPPNGLVMGQVKILKRGEDPIVQTLPPPPSQPDLGSTKPLGPDPTQIRVANESMMKITNVNRVPFNFYAGSAFNVISPPPSSVPLPAFFTKKVVDENDVASSILKQVLRLDL
ncbi:hypothetical protein ACFE04_011629 [Oxalis oulophora]